MFWPFWWLKKFRKIYILNILFDYFSLKYKEDIFKRKTIGLCDFLKIKYFLSRVQPIARTAKLGQFLGIEKFGIEKSGKSIHPIVRASVCS